MIAQGENRGHLEGERHMKRYFKSRMRQYGMLGLFLLLIVTVQRVVALEPDDAGALLAGVESAQTQWQSVPPLEVEVAQDVTVTEPASAADPVVADTVPAPPAPAEEPVVETPDAAGVMPRLVLEADVRQFLKIVGQTFQKNIVPSPQVRGMVTVDLYEVTFEEALDAVLGVNGFAYEQKNGFIFVYTQKEMAEMKAAARKLESRVFKLNYLSPDDVSNLVQPLVGTNGKVTVSPAAGTATAASGEKWAGNNILIVQAYPEQLDQVAKVIAEMDRRPAQVLIEATILTADLSDTNQLGIDLLYDGGINFEFFDTGVVEVGSQAGTDGGLETTFTTSVGTGGLSIGVTSNNIGVLIRALESTTDVVTLGNPKVMTLNRQQGMVLVGNRDGYITTEVSQTTATQTVKFLETGTQLQFRPFIMDDGYIRMELNPKDSDGGVEVQGQFTLPSESTTEVMTNVLVKDGHTIVIGGLFRDRTSISRSQVPFFGNIPVVGALFRSTTDVSTREEVIFLITPHIIQEEIDYAIGERILETADDMVIAAREGLQWHTRDRLAMAHYNWAREHQAAGDLDAALWDINLAAHISPAFLDAQRLRWELLGEEVYYGEFGSMRKLMRELVERSRGL
jgi:type IV pilus assembly protein PilQ